VSIRLAAIGDLHVRTNVPDGLVEHLAALHHRADALVVTGDITDGGRLPEVELAAEALGAASVPVVAVLGNHDRRCLRRAAFRRILERAGVTLLDGEAATLRLGTIGVRVGFAGVGGYGGGFWPDEGPSWPQFRLSQAIAVRARREAARLEAALGVLADDQPQHRVVVMHYAPTATTLGNEPLVKYWMLGNIELARVIDRHEVDLVLHGHAHLGNSHGQTPGGTPVRNVAVSVTGGFTFVEIAGPRARPPASSPWRSDEDAPVYAELAERRR
jgi:Icc-related predicted phosphoesterase